MKILYEVRKLILSSGVDAAYVCSFRNMMENLRDALQRT